LERYTDDYDDDYVNDDDNDDDDDDYDGDDDIGVDNHCTRSDTPNCKNVVQRFRDLGR